MREVKTKLEGSDIWEELPTLSEEEKKSVARRHADFKKEVEDLILKNLKKIRLSYESEDEIRQATMAELMEAVESARAEELERFLCEKDKYLSFEDGYVSVSF